MNTHSPEGIFFLIRYELLGTSRCIGMRNIRKGSTGFVRARHLLLQGFLHPRGRSRSGYFLSCPGKGKQSGADLLSATEWPTRIPSQPACLCRQHPLPRWYHFYRFALPEPSFVNDRPSFNDARSGRMMSRQRGANPLRESIGKKAISTPTRWKVFSMRR